MINIISPNKFKTIPWKNGLGETTELAISDGGDLSKFDWRISIASVVKDGLFSDFSGYQRNLILIKGNGISLEYDDNKSDKLEDLLSVANFDGDSRTIGRLIAGPIKDFNIMTSKDKYISHVNTYIQQETLSLSSKNLCFAYSLTDDIKIENKENNLTCPTGSLLKIFSTKKSDIINYELSGENMVVIQFISR